MTSYRLRANVRFVVGNGLAQWCFDQNTVRLTQAFHLNPGTPQQESSRHSVAADVYSCDLIFPQAALALDTWATLIAVCTTGNTRVNTGRELSWMDYHACEHGAPSAPCPAPINRWVRA